LSGGIGKRDITLRAGAADGRPGGGGGGGGSQAAPARVRLAEGVAARDVACGQQHALILAADGAVYASGSNVFGQLGMAAACDSGGASGSAAAAGTVNWARWVAAKKRQTAALSPVRVAVPEAAAAVAAGAFHSAVAARSGRLWVFGHSGYAQLGSSAAEHEDMGGSACDDASYGAPRTLKALEGETVTRLACGGLYTMAVTEAGDLYTWGWGSGGALGARVHTPQGMSSQTGAASRPARAWSHAPAMPGPAHPPCPAPAAPCWARQGTCPGQPIACPAARSRCTAPRVRAGVRAGHGSSRYRLQPLKVGPLDGLRVSVCAAGGKHSLAVAGGGRRDALCALLAAPRIHAEVVVLAGPAGADGRGRARPS